GEPAGDLADAIIEGGVGDVLAAVFQRTARRLTPGVKGDDAGQVDHPRLVGPFPLLTKYDQQFAPRHPLCSAIQGTGNASRRVGTSDLHESATWGAQARGWSGQMPA